MGSASRSMELQRLYASMNDDDLLRIALTTEFTDEAEAAMVQELEKRDLLGQLDAYDRAMREESQEIAAYQAKRGRLAHLLIFLVLTALPILLWECRHWLR